jgi:Z1 domain
MSTLDVDFGRLRSIAAQNNRYEQQLHRLRQNGKQTTCIEEAVSKAVANISTRTAKSFIIYGEPQSGKTEMMICLTAKLVDSGFDILIHLLNDSVQLLQQNLDRFQRSGLAPAAKNFSDVLDPEISLRTGQHVIFCKKNASDLAKLIQKTRHLENKIIIDDEADYATPNAAINRGEVTKINHLVGNLIGDDGIYIGVTATPARLDLNNTFENDNEQWVNFPPHNEYTGQDIFFPMDPPIRYNLVLLPDTDDNPKYLREALFRFMVRVAYVNLKHQRDDNYSMLIHTSGKKVDHRSDKKPIDDVLNGLADTHSPKFEGYVRDIKKIADNLYGPEQADRILSYIIRTSTRASVIIMNSERDKNVDFKSATSPAALYTIIIGGNIVSRGVTFENLLSMFFTRDAKHKIQQDTYIQRARMFGSRKAQVPHFELTIPNQLYLDWHRCFVFHKLALEAIRAGLGSPVWLSDSRISAVSPASIDRAHVSLDRGEMSFSLFDYNPAICAIADAPNDPIRKLKVIQEFIGPGALPEYLVRYVQRTLPFGDKSIAIHSPASIKGYKEADGLNKDKIERAKGFFGKSQREKFPEAIHHFAIFHNEQRRARVIYKFVGNISFIKNLKHV